MMIFVAAAAATSVVAHLLLRSFWIAVSVSAVAVTLMFVRYAADTSDPFSQLGVVFAGIYAAGISLGIGAAIRVIRRIRASDGERQSRFNGMTWAWAASGRRFPLATPGWNAAAAATAAHSVDRTCADDLRSYPQIRKPRQRRAPVSR